MEHMISARVLYWQKSLLLLVLLTSCCAQSTYYVTPTPDTPCPGEPCHTLSQYVTEQYFKNFTGNVRMEFLHGNHTLEQTISLANLTQLTLHGDSSSLPEVTSRIMISVCDSQARRGFVFAGTTELHISELAFISGVCGGGIAILESEQQSDITHSMFQNIPLYVHNSTLTALTGNTFQNTESPALYAQYSRLELTGNMFQNVNPALPVGTLHVVSSNLSLIGNTFHNNTAVLGGALYVHNGNLNLTGNAFHNNAVVGSGGTAGWGGALYVDSGNLNLTGNTFHNNTAEDGGALYVASGSLNLTGNTFHTNSADGDGGGAVSVGGGNLNLTENTFYNNTAGKGGSLSVDSGNLNLTGNTFHNNAAPDWGGALYVDGGNLNLTGNTFHNNAANLGGALFVDGGNLNFTGNTFHNNAAPDWGGALYVDGGNLNLTGNIFYNNTAEDGGALYVDDGNLNLTGNTFHSNAAPDWGGALYVDGGNLNLTGNTFYNNTAEEGGALYVNGGNLNLTGNTFHNNSAGYAGGVLSVHGGNLNLAGNIFNNNSADRGGALSVNSGNLNLNLVGNTFQNNSAVGSGGSLSLESSNVILNDNNFTDSYASSGGAIAATQSSNVRLYGSNVLANNTAQYGGGIIIVDSQLELVGSLFTVKNNTASYGGGLYVHNTNISGNATFNANSAAEGGGGIYASRSTFYFMGNTTFMENSAIDGGGLLLSDDSKFYLQQNTHVYFASNIAKRNGGAIKVEESNPITYCTDTYKSDCFFQIQKEINWLSISQIKVILADLNATIHFDNNSAIEAGADLHGGSVDNCENYIVTDCEKYRHDCPTSGNVFDDISNSSKNTLDISSDPLHICTCRDSRTDCSGSYHPEPVYPGGTLEVPVIARGQRNGSTTAKIQVIDTPDSNIVFKETETIQNTNKNCTTLKYTIQSTAEHLTQEVTLYVEGPCPPVTIRPSPTKMNTMLNTLRVIIDILDCPPGFQLSQTQPAICICTDRLQQFTNTCRVDDQTVLRKHHAQFWVGYDNDSRGVILDPHCPFDYCTSEETYLTVNDSDKQCNYNRSGLLCGRCSDNLSIALGSSRCLQCSNSYLAVLAAFLLAGVALVVFLLALRLTVAAGTINGLIFYANVVAVNSATFFQPQTSSIPIGNVLTVFIAWLNLDLGIETCFYNGMDAYVKTWLQFAFPLYIWALVGMIILGSHYSSRVAKMFGSNPIAVLATLFLLSYAKLLRTVIAALSYTSLEYPNNSQIAVWLYDGNTRYLSGKHIPLFTTAVVCLIFLFLPYTMLLIFSQWLQAHSKFKIFSWIDGRNFKPFLDAYHAPYTDKHRYWTGLMLLLRFVLSLVSAANALGDPSVNLLATLTTTIAILTLTTILGARIYKTWCLSFLETSFILNLAILSAASLYIRPTGAGGSQNAAILTSVGIAFATFTGIVIFHSVQQLKGTRLWRRVCLRHDYMRVPLTDVDSGPEEDPRYAVFVPGSAPTHTVVAIRANELREPCMETD